MWFMPALPFPLPQPIPSHIARNAAIAGIGLLALGLISFALGLRVNTTRSIPVGLYRMTDVRVAKGEYVIFCPPQSALFDEAKQRGYIGAGFCPGDYGFMMKRVAAVGGDKVASSEEGIVVNGEVLPASAPLKTDKAGRMMPRHEFYEYTLGESELLLMSDVSSTSFDGRYFGPVDMVQVKGVIRPIITF
jgi:conjugative transfer signal peptidase TraF